MEEKRKWDHRRPIASTGKNMYNGKKPRKEPAACFTAVTAFVGDLSGDEERNQALAALIGRLDMKQEFLNYIGPGDSLAGYARSYKLVLYKAFFSLMDGNGMAPGYRVAEAFREFYVDRVRRGLKADIRVDSRIENINESSVQDVYEVILLNPLKRISDKGYLSRKRDSNGKEQFVLNQELLKELTKEDIADILDVVNQKLNLYYARADGNESDMTLHDLVYRWMDEYAEILSSVKENNDFKNPFREIISKEIPTLLTERTPVSSPYSVVGSYGKGRWTDVPWIAVFDSRITTSAQKGVYIVYLLNKDTKTLYLTLNQGATNAAQSDGIDEETKTLTFTSIALSQNEKMTERLQKSAEKIRAIIGDTVQTYGQIDSGSPGYDAGTIYYKEYTLNSLPDDFGLISDLRDFLALYADYYGKISGGEEALPVKDTISQIKSYIASKGFSYEEGLIENFYLSLKSKPFVILAGTSGTGKTRLVKLFAEAVGATAENGRYRMVPVRPDWSDSSDLFGHVDLNGNFIPGAIIDFVRHAEDDGEHPCFLCLDEMNLARVEYYLSDILSVIETRNLVDGKITSAPLVTEVYYDPDEKAAGHYGVISFPENLYIVGTVNMDETTFPFSRKVLDRANTIEFSHVDLIPNFGAVSFEEPQALSLKNSFLKSEYLLLNQCAAESKAVTGYCLELQKINGLLQKANAHVGYRVRDEIVFYLLNNKRSGLLPEEQAMDNELMQKILPRIQGSGASVKSMLCELFKVCAGDYDGYQVQSDNVSDKMRKTLNDAGRKIKYRHSAEKIEMMVRRFEEDGFTSYWL